MATGRQTGTEQIPCPPNPTGEHILNDLMGKGLVRLDIETNEYQGHASDGKWVGIGSGYSYREMLRFLEDRPTPDRW